MNERVSDTHRPWKGVQQAKLQESAPVNSEDALARHFTLSERLDSKREVD